MAEQYIFTIESLTKFYSKREVLKNIWLAFYPGAKIGVIGPNGSGKSTLLRVMALQSKPTSSAPPASADWHQHRLRPAGAAARRAGTDRPRKRRSRPSPPPAACSRSQEDIGNKMAEAVAGGVREALRRRWTSVHVPASTPCQRLQPRPHNWKWRWTPCACRPATPTRSAALRRRTAARRPVQDACCMKPDLLLLDEPTNHLDAESRRLARTPPPGRTPAPSSAVTHDRYFLDNVAQWILEMDRGHGHPLQGQLLRRGWSRSRPALVKEEKAGVGPQARRWSASWSGREWPRAPAPAKNKARLSPLTKSSPARSTRSANDDLVIQIPLGAARWAAPGRAGRGREARAFGDNLLFEGMNFDLPQRRHRRRDRPERGRQDDAIPHDRRPGDAGRRLAASSGRR